MPSHLLRITRAPVHSTDRWCAQSTIRGPRCYSPLLIRFGYQCCLDCGHQDSPVNTQALLALITHIMCSFHYAPGLVCWGSASLYVPPLSYKREGTQRYRDSFLHTSSYAQAYTLNTTHSGGRVLRSGGLNHSKPLCPPVFILNPHNRQTAKAPSSF